MSASGGRGILEEAIFHLKNQSGAVDRTGYSKLADWISVKDYGAIGDGLNDDTNAITNAIAAAAGTQLLNFPFPGPYITSTYGTIQGGIYYPPLAFTGAVLRSVPAKLLDSVTVLDFGADPTGLTDSTAALQNALTALSGTAGKNLLIPSGTYNVSSTLNFHNMRSMQILGDGSRDTILHWTGAAGGTAFLFRNCYRIVAQGIRFDRSNNDPAILVEMREDDTQADYNGTAPSQLNTFRECTFVNGAIGLGFTFVTHDVMNDSHRVEHGLFSAQTTTAVSINGQNAMGIRFEQTYSINAPHAVTVELLAGSFKWAGGYVNNTVSNFLFNSFSDDGYHFDGVRSEQSPRFIDYQGGSAQAGAFLLSNVSYSASALNADGWAIRMNGSGPLTCVGSKWGITADGATQASRFQIANVASQPFMVNLIGNAFGFPGADAVSPVQGAVGVRINAIGNKYKTAAANWIWKAEEFAPFAERETTLTYTTGVAMALDASTASIFKLVVNDTVAVVINAPTNGTAWQTIKIQIKATAAMNAANPFGGTGWRAGTVPIPTSGNGYIYVFMYDGNSWYQIGTPNLVAN